MTVRQNMQRVAVAVAIVVLAMVVLAPVASARPDPGEPSGFERTGWERTTVATGQSTSGELRGWERNAASTSRPSTTAGTTSGSESVPISTIVLYAAAVAGALILAVGMVRPLRSHRRPARVA